MAHALSACASSSSGNPVVQRTRCRPGLLPETTAGASVAPRTIVTGIAVSTSQATGASIAPGGAIVAGIIVSTGQAAGASIAPSVAIATGIEIPTGVPLAINGRRNLVLDRLERMWQECSWPEQWGGGGTTGSGRKKGETSKGSGRKPEWEVTTLLGGTTLHQSLRYPEFSFEDTDGLQEGSFGLSSSSPPPLVEMAVMTRGGAATHP